MAQMLPGPFRRVAVCRPPGIPRDPDELGHGVFDGDGDDVGALRARPLAAFAKNWRRE